MKTRPLGSRTAARRRWSLEVERVEDRLLLSTFTVTNTNDDGDGSLRQAILASDATPSTPAQPNRIRFNIGDGTQRITPTSSALPPITQPVDIDGAAPSDHPSQVVEISGARLTSSQPDNPIAGLLILGDGNVVRNLVIVEFAAPGDSGIEIFQGRNNRIQSNDVGTDRSGGGASGIPPAS